MQIQLQRGREGYIYLYNTSAAREFYQILEAVYISRLQNLSNSTLPRMKILSRDQKVNTE